ncbi:hypothetical protein ILYODFUR_010458 [Ilyodon furcidens]|uniref:Uncharacterized protein n=1 Tax=Ilyodon furcidens TaxID=33524 RepID=A0ABV0UHS2_9TELE
MTSEDRRCWHSCSDSSFRGEVDLPWGQLTAVQDAASRTPREECPAALGQAGRPGPDGGPLHGEITEPHQPLGVL